MNREDRNPKDPRVVFPGHRERGPRRFCFTYQDLADAAGVGKATVIAYVCRKKLDMSDLAAIASFITEHRARAASKEK